MKRALLTLIFISANATITHADSPQSRQGFVDVPGGPVWYQVSGDGAGIPLLALHGGPGGTSCGLSLLEELGSERPVIRYDQLGTGRSGRPDDMSLWTVARFVEELHAVRKALGLERMHLLGHSWGSSLSARNLRRVLSRTLAGDCLLRFSRLEGYPHAYGQPVRFGFGQAETVLATV